MLAFADCETTGFYVDAGHEAWEIAVLTATYEGEIVAERTWQLPVDVSKADPMALAMNGWYMRSVQQRQGLGQMSVISDEPQLTEPTTFAREFMQLVHGHVLVGAVPSFDERFITKALRRGGGVQCWHYQPIDVETLAAGWLLGQAEVLRGVYAESSDLDADMRFVTAAEKLRTPRWDSEELSKLVGVDPDKFAHHSAAGDVRWAKAIYDVIMMPPVS